MSDSIDRQKVLNTLDNADKFLDEERTVEKYKELLTECIKVLPSSENDGDLISRQAVENITWEEPSYTDPLNVLTEVREKVRALPSAENKGEWIPVTEKLPKDHEEVLIYLSSNRITIGLYNSHVLPLAPYKPIGWGVNAQTAVHNFCSDDVVAWMPLPDPYKAEKGDK